MQKALVAVERTLFRKCINYDQNLGEKEQFLAEQEQYKIMHENFRAHYEQLKVELTTY